MSNIQTLIQQAAGTHMSDEVSMSLATVVSVDEAKRECTADVVTGKSYVTVTAKLMASVDDGVLYIPAVESQVLLIYSKTTPPFVAMYSELSKMRYIVGDSGIEVTKDLVKLNDGSFGGLIKIKELLSRINNIENALNSHITKYNTHTHTGVQTGGGTSAVTAAIDSTSLTVTKQSDIENTNITHGSKL